jgi:hypothetical protein
VVERDIAVAPGATRTLDVELGTAPPAPVYPTPAPALTAAQPVPPPPPLPAPTPTPAPTVAATAPPPAPTATITPRRVTLRGALRHGIPLRLTCASACRVRAVVRIGGRVAGLTTRTLRAHQPATVRLRLRPHARRHRRGRDRVRATVAVQLRSADGQTRTLRRTLMLRRG